MALANVQYTANGATTVFVVSFGYLQQSHITVTVDDIVTTAYTFNGSGDIEFNVAPANGVIVFIVRDSDISQKLVEYADGSNLTEEDLNNGADQGIFLQQETRDQIDTINADNSAVVGRVDDNEAAIIVNAGDISTNTTNIGTNATNIGTNDTDIATNAADIATNVDAIVAANGTDIFTARIDEVGGLSAGDVVYINGATGSQMEASKAVNNDFEKIDAIAIAFEDGSDNSTIRFLHFGELSGLDTSSYSEGDTLYLDSTAGQLTNVHPTGIDAVMRVARVVRSHASQGIIFVHIVSQIASNNHDGIVRFSVTNQNAGTGASTTYTLINDAGHQSSISLTSSNFSGFAEFLSFYNLGYGGTNNVIDGNQDFAWYTDVGDTHDFSATEKMRLTAAGELQTLTQTINGTTTIDGVLDEDNMVSNSATKLVTQKSVKAYADTKVAGTGGTATGTSIVTPSRSDIKQDTKANLETYAVSATDGQLVFATDTGEVFKIFNNGLELLGGGGGGGGLDSFYTEDFETSVSASDFTQGNDATFDNGGSFNGVFTDTTSSNISGTKSIIYTQASGSLNDWFKSPVITVQKKQQGQTVGTTLYYTYDGDSDDIKFVAYDNTGSVVLSEASNLVKKSLGAQRFSVDFPVPTDSISVAWGFQVVTENIGAVLVVDDIEISTDPFVYKNMSNDTEWKLDGVVDIVATTTDPNKGTIVYDNTYSRRSGDSLDMNINYNQSTAGSNGSGTYFIKLPDNLVGDASKIQTSSSSIAGIVGHGILTGSGGIEFNIQLTLDSTDPTRLAMQIQGNSGSNIQYVYNPWSSTTFSLGNTTLKVSARITVPIEGWATESEQVIAYNSRNAENSVLRLNTANGHGSTNTKIRRFSSVTTDTGSAMTYTDSVSLGASVVINEAGMYFISYTDGRTNNVANVGISLDSSALTTNIESITDVDRLSSTGTVSTLVGVAQATIQLEVGAVIRPHTDGTTQHTSQSSFTITKIGVGDLLGVPVARTAYIKDVKASGSNGGTFTSGAWQTRDLNDLSGDTEFVSLSSNQFVLQPGKYITRSLAPAHNANIHKAKLRNITDSTDDIMGKVAHSASSSVATDSSVTGVIEILVPTTFEIQHRCAVTKATNGFGAAASFGVDEVYTTVEITKIS